MYQKVNLRDRVIAITIAFAMVVVLFASYAEDVSAQSLGATTATEYTYQEEPVYSGTTSYRGDIGTEKLVTYYYSDGYFKDDSTKYNSHLATMSIVLAMSAMDNTVAQAKSLFQAIDCEDIKSRDFEDEQGHKITPTAETIGAVYGHKTIFPDTSAEAELVPIAIRGAFYDMEWVNNFILGLFEDAQGFNQAASKVLESIESYLIAEGIDNENVIFWVAGYSRGGTVANLLAKKLSDLNGVGKEDVFAYSFEAQRAAFNNSKSYDNLHVVSNYNDFLTLVMPDFSNEERFSFYGKEKVIADSSKSNFKTQEARMLEHLESIADIEKDYVSPTKFKYKKLNSAITGLDNNVLNILAFLSDDFSPFVDDTKSKSKTQRDCENLVIERLKKKAIVNRAAYTQNTNRDVDINSDALGEEPYNLEEVAAAVIQYIQKDYGVIEDLIENFSNFPVSDYFLANIQKIQGLVKYLKTMTISSIWGSYDNLLQDVWSILDKDNGDYKAISKVLTAEQVKQLKAMLPITLYTIAAFTSNDIGKTPETIATVIENIDSTAQAHYTEINFSWIAIEDTFYYPDYEPIDDPEEDDPSDDPGTGGGGGGGSGGGGGGGTTDPSQDNPPEEQAEEEQQDPIEEIVEVVKTAISKIKAGKKMFTLSWKKNSDASGYKIQYGTNSKFKKGTYKTKTIKTNKTTTCKIKKLKSYKKYYVRICCYKKENDKTVYSKWTTKKTVKTK